MALHQSMFSSDIVGAVSRAHRRFPAKRRFSSKAAVPAVPSFWPSVLLSREKEHQPLPDDP